MKVTRATVVQGFLLHAQAIEETHYLCDILTPEFGVIRSKVSGGRPEFFRQFEVKLLQKNNFYSCHDFRYTQPLLIFESPARLYGLYLNELTFLLLPKNIEIGGFYGTYASTLVQVQANTKLLPSLRFFEKQLLILLGSAIDYQRSVDGLPIQSRAQYSFEAGMGFSVDSKGAILGETILANFANQYDVKGALALARHCQYHQLALLLEDKPVNSREWLKQLTSKVELKS
jgi:DNA repair protein RecO (recombination protein O)